MSLQLVLSSVYVHKEPSACRQLRYPCSPLRLREPLVGVGSDNCRLSLIPCLANCRRIGLPFESLTFPYAQPLHFIEKEYLNRVPIFPKSQLC